ncbi:4-(cytidine 5'-diphospho)-2-C-methyl-D-erythritol kinase [Aestuariivirga sp.]|uniref:4-(cytidine 5'-diphospho)-2-C-methyl-D-erythritol kinase n=1 Tax=Aestuariivirga sp. TaxID=2650926 RepID=UPI00391CC8D7
MAFSLFAPAKVNLALHVLGRRADGYHELDSIVGFADIGDRLDFSPSDAFAITAEGRFAAALPPPGENIIAGAWKAAGRIASARGTLLPPVSVHLVKNLPLASGIGGGSANAAAALRGFLRLAGITGLDPEIMAEGLALGADVPVCLAGRACRMRGVGERITPLEGFGPLKAILVNPLVEVSTAAVFRQLALAPGQGLGEAIRDERDPSGWRNDLAAAAAAIAPVIGEVLERLVSAPGVKRAFMSGSGATCVALYEGEAPAPRLEPGWWSARAVIR